MNRLLSHMLIFKISPINAFIIWEVLNLGLKGAWCINCHHVEDIFNLPPGFGKENVVYSYIGMELDARGGQTRPYNVYISINGHRVGTLSNTFPRGYYHQLLHLFILRTKKISA